MWLCVWFCCLVKVTNPALSIAVLFDSLDTAWQTHTTRFVLVLAGAVGASGTARRRAVFVRLWPHNEIATKTRSLLVECSTVLQWHQSFMPYLKKKYAIATHILISDRNIFSKRTCVAISLRPGAHVGERNLLLSAIRPGYRQIPPFSPGINFWCHVGAGVIVTHIPESDRNTFFEKKHVCGDIS